MATDVRGAGDRRQAIRDLIASTPSRGVEEAIATAARAKGGETSAKVLDLLAQAVYTTRDLDSGGDPITFKELGRRKLKGGDRRYIVAVLLRLLAANPQAVSDTTMRRYFRNVVDELPDRLVAALQLPEDTFEHRFVELPEVAPKAERTLDAVFMPFDSIAGIRTFQAEFLKALQDPFVIASIRPFLSNDLIEGLFRPLVAAADRCLDLTAGDAIDSVYEARRQLDAFAHAARAIESEYSDRYLVRIAEIVSTDLEHRFAESSLSQPAELRLRTPRKRFPLHLVGSELKLQLEIENAGEGPARDVRIRFEEDTEVELLEPDHSIPFVGPDGRLLAVPALVMESCDRANLVYEIEWVDASGEERSQYMELPLRSQDREVDWEAFNTLNVYPQKAIDDDRKLAGRGRLLEELTALATGPEVGSTRVSGEKRVGKSSLVRSLKTRLDRLPGDALVAIYIDVNKLGADDEPRQAIGALMSKIARELRSASLMLADIEPPPFDQDPVSDFAEFLDEARNRLNGRSVLAIVDEFDEMPNGAFERSGPGDAFFRALKAFSSEGDCGFVLVGGEKLELALGPQNDRLNAFGEHRVDYIDDDQIEDYIDLVRGPVAGYLEFERDAIERLHSLTAGHPFYTVLVCRQVVSQAKTNRDNHVTIVEMEEAYQAALQLASATSFAHIWFDYAYVSPDEMTAIVDRRLLLLLAWAACLRSRAPVTVAALVEEGQRLGLDATSVQQELRQLTVRRLVVERDGRVEARSRFVEDWVRDWGPERIRVDGDASETIQRLAEEEQRQRVGAAEIRDLRDKLPPYQSKPIEAEDIRAWLDQFPDMPSQRLALKVLQAVRFVSNLEVRKLFEEIHAHARRSTTIQVEPDKRYRREFALVYVERDGKSASLMAKQYAHANKIHATGVTSAARLEDYLAKNECERVVVVDDFIGTGRTATDRLIEHAGLMRQAAAATGRDVVLGVACAFQSGVRAVEQAIADAELPVEICVGEMLMDSDRCFHESAGIFDSTEERLIAKRLFETTARSIGSNEPLGTGDCEGLLVFEHNCPNNTLPLLWKRSDGWTPLFARITAAG